MVGSDSDWVDFELKPLGSLSGLEVFRTFCFDAFKNFREKFMSIKVDEITVLKVPPILGSLFIKVSYFTKIS